MQTVIEYLKSTYTKTSLYLMGILGAVLVAGFFLSFILAIKSSVKKPKAKPEEKDESAVRVKEWKITNLNGEYFAELFIGDKAILSSAKYTSLSGVKSAIITIDNNLKENNLSETVENGKFIFKVFSSSGKVLATSVPHDYAVDLRDDILSATEKLS